MNKPADSASEQSLSRAPLNTRIFAAAYQLRRHFPELLNSIPDDLRIRLQNGDPSVLPELLKAQPEAFRNELLGRLEDDAFRKLLASDGQSQFRSV